jgi:predicted Zn-dependent protease
MKLRLKHIAAAVLLAGCGLAAAQDAGKALGGLLRSINPGSLLNNLPAAAPQPSGSGSASELLKLLGDSGDHVDEARELEIGRELAALLVGSKPLHGDVALQRYVNRLGRWISLQGSRPNLPWTFAVLDDAGFNAFAAPGGYVFVTKGLVDRVDEAELAGIVAHEITHVNRRHHLQALAAGARAGIATQAIASQLRGANALSGQLLALGRNMYARGLDRGDEFEADREGVALAARAGFDPYGLPSVLQQLRTARADDPLFALTLGTHPPAQQRLEQLAGAMGTRLDALAGKPSVPIAQRLR